MSLGIPVAVQVALGAIYGLLAVVTLLALGLKRFKPEKDWSELWLRTRSWWVIVTLFAAAILLDRGAAIILLGFVSFLALKEYLSLIPTRRADRRVLFWAYVAIPLQYFWVYEYWYGMFIVFIPVWVFLFLPLRMLLIGATDGFLHAIGSIQWGVMLTVFGLSHAAYLMSLPELDISEAGSVGLLLFLIVLTALGDVAQYAWGKGLGRRKIVPKVSPGKTWEGFIGGAVTIAALGYMLGPWLTPLSGLQSAGAGFAIAAAGFVGDVTISAIKRDLGVKDSGSTIPGHGGILDRVDSLTFSAPVFFHLVFYFHYGPPILSGGS